MDSIESRKENAEEEINREEKVLSEKELAKIRERLDNIKDERKEVEGKNNVKMDIPKLWAIGIAIAIIIVTIVIRMPMLQYQGFFEPDGFFHYSIINQAVANHFMIPQYSMLSGFPVHNPVTEPDGLYYVTLVPYYFLRYFGITTYTIERLAPIFFGVLDVIGAYLLGRYLANSRALGLLAMFMVAFSGGDAARTSAGVYRGDGFITIFLIIALVLIIKALTVEDTKKRYSLMALGAVILGIGTAVWNGAPFVIIVYILAVMFLIVYSFIAGRLRMLKDTIFLSLALLITYAIENLLIMDNFIRANRPLSSYHFFIFYIPILLGSVLLYKILESRRFGMESKKNRAYFVAIIAIIAAAVIISLFYSYLLQISTGEGLVIAGTPLTVTIQELQKPTFPFLWASFSLEIFLAFIGIAAFVIFSMWKKFSSNMRTISFAAFMVILAYFVVTMYLQANAIRYNSLVALPIAIFAAYAIYSIGKFFSMYSFKRVNLLYPYMAIALVILIVIIYVAYRQSTYETQADGINQNFINATLWLRNNTAQNATVLALWPDGSVVEGFGNRQSLMDSVSGQNPSLIANFSDFLFNTSIDSEYLYSIHPDYILVRNYWFSEFGGIATEGSVKNATAFGLVNLNPQKPVRNSTETAYGFVGGGYKALMVISNSNGVGAYISYNNGSFVPISHVLFYNMDNGSYSEANITGNTYNYTLLVTYIVNSSGLGVGTGALMGPKLSESNFFKLLVLCNAQACAYGNSNISLSQVYANSDTKIYKVNYLK